MCYYLNFQFQGQRFNVVVLFSLNDVTLSLWMLTFRRLLTFSDSTYWQLIIDVYTVCLIEGDCIQVYTLIINGQYVLSQKVNKLLHHNIQCPDVTSLLENKTTTSTKNPQTQLNRNGFLVFCSQTTFHDYNILQIQNSMYNDI